MRGGSGPEGDDEVQRSTIGISPSVSVLTVQSFSNGDGGGGRFVFGIL